MDNGDLLFSSFYFRHLSLLEHFCDYFDEKAKDIIDCTDKTKLATFKKGYNFSNLSPQALSEQKIQEFLQEVFLEKRLLKTREKEIFLSKRETECLKYLRVGKTMKEIARILDLSPRTIEFYLQNIKKKSSLNRGELIAHFSNNFPNGY